METRYLNEIFVIDKSEIIDRSIIKKDFVRYSPTSLSTVNTANTLIRIDIPRESSYISLYDAYLEIEVEVTKLADGSRYVDGNAIELVNLGGIALFTTASLSSSSNKKIEEVDNVHLASLMYKMLSAGGEELMTYFKKDAGDGAAIDVVKRNRLINDTDEKGTIFLRVNLADIFGYCLNENKVTYGLGYTIDFKRAANGNVIFRTIGDAANLRIIDLGLYISHYIPSIDSQSYINNIIIKKENISLGFLARQTFSKLVNTNNQWSFELGVQAGLNIPSYVFVAFQSSNRQGPDQEQNNGVFDTLDVIEAYVKIGSVRYPDYSINVDYERNKYNEAYNAIVTFYKEFIGEQNLPPYITYREFKTLYNIYVFDLRAQQDQIASQDIRVEFKFRPGYDAVGNNYRATALVLTNKLIEVSSDGQRLFDVI